MTDIPNERFAGDLLRIAADAVAAGLSTGRVWLVVCGVLLFVAVLTGVVVWFWWSRRLPIPPRPSGRRHLEEEDGEEWIQMTYI